MQEIGHLSFEGFRQRQFIKYNYLDKAKHIYGKFVVNLFLGNPEL